MASITAYVDFMRFGVLPFPGGTFEQPAELMDELRFITDQVAAFQARKAKSR